MRARALVTGVAGFIGSHVAEECLRLGFDVTGLDDLSGGFLVNVPPGVRWLRGSVMDGTSVERLFEEARFDYVYHLAAYAAEGLSHFIRRFNYENNVIGSVNLINAAIRHHVRCFVFTSSIAVYGRNQVPMKEDLTPLPQDPYGIAKYAVELDLQAAREMFGLNYVIFRPHNVYGERQNIADRYRNVVSIFMNQALRELPMTIFGDGLQTRAFSYVRDVAPVMARSVLVPECYGDTFNVGADRPCTVIELAREVAQALGVEPRIVHLPPRKEVVHAYASHTRAEQMFGPLSRTSLPEGLQAMAEWVKAIGVREPIRFERIEILENLPASWQI